MSPSNRGGRRNQHARAAAIQRTGGPYALTERAHALMLRAWPCYIHYRRLEDVQRLLHDSDTSMAAGKPPDPDSFLAVLRKRLDEDPYTSDDSPAHVDLAALGFPVTEPPGALPATAQDPGLSPLRPELVSLSLACDRALPAVIAALADDTVPGELAQGSEQQARSALAELYDRYRTLDPRYDVDGRALVDAFLARTPPGGPRESRPGGWGWMGRIVQDTGYGVTGAEEGMPLRCFGDLDAAKRWAIWQTDFSASLLGDVLRDNPDFNEVVAQILALDRATSARFPQPGSGYTLLLVTYADARERGPQHAI
jgi:hypothetical protein